MAKRATEEFSHSGGEGHKESGYGLDEFKKEADPIVYGQAGHAGCKSDQGKIKSQMKGYHWEK